MGELWVVVMFGVVAHMFEHFRFSMMTQVETKTIKLAVLLFVQGGDFFLHRKNFYDDIKDKLV